MRPESFTQLAMAMATATTAVLNNEPMIPLTRVLDLLMSHVPAPAKPGYNFTNGRLHAWVEIPGQHTVGTKPPDPHAPAPPAIEVVPPKRKGRR